MKHSEADKHNKMSMAKAQNDCSMSQSPRKVSYAKPEKTDNDKDDKDETSMSKLTRTSFAADEKKDFKEKGDKSKDEKYKGFSAKFVDKEKSKDKK